MARMLVNAHRGRECRYGCCGMYRKMMSWRGVRGKLRAREKSAWQREEMQ